MRIADSVKRLLYTPEGVSKLAMFGIGMLILLKVFGAVVTGSIGIRSDAIHSGIDLVGAMVGFIAIRVALRPPDESHPYGHNKAENVAGLFIAGLIFFAAGAIIYEAVRRLIEGGAVEMLTVGIWVTLGAIVINLSVSWWALRIAKKTESVALQATGRDLYADVLSSVAVLIGLVLVRVTGLVILDPIVAILVGLLIFRTALITMRQSLGELMDENMPEEEESVVKQCIEEHSERIVGFHELRSRKAGNMRFMDLHMVVPRHVQISDAHEICDHIEHHVRHRMARTSITIHLEPCETECVECSVVCEIRKN